ncbi:MAG: hypothetical protein ACR2FV_12880 [Ornithinimicrobium sp.]|uniref:restriction system modified-DNA reader domain-containing protein n=1 Tax=Ornithinimicrobium sp. TaxID=1977084 RepID=UPI003D9AD999
MPLYEFAEGSLKPFHRLRPGPTLYEQEIEALVWADLEAFTGESLFPVARQARISGGGVPDILALDETGRVVVIEVKRDVDRGQLAQCLEYAGWARLTNLDEVAGLYDGGRPGHRGVEAFFRDWQDFTETTTPVTITPQPRLYLVARDFEGRTRSALEFLKESSLPVTVVPVTIYQDPAGRRIIDIEADHDPTLPVTAATVTRPQAVTVNGRRVTVLDLLDADLLQPNDSVEFVRPRLGQHYEAVIRGDGTFELSDGSVHQSPSRAAMQAADLVSYDGWYAWRVPRLGGTKLHELREQYVAATVTEVPEPQKLDRDAPSGDR